MNRSKNIFALLMLFSAMVFGACTQDDTMDDLIDNTEINSPSPTNNDPDPETDGEDDIPGGGG